MNEGGKAILLIPSDLAYGPYGSGSIPGYTPLVFEVELIDVF
jgi:FKBP-type peptidyl-prolyl cis-trans isomerase